MKIGDKVDSDHHPLEIWIEGETQRRREKDKEQEIRKEVWDSQGRERFRKSLRLERREGKEIDEEWREIEKKIKKALKIVGERQRRRRGWWDDECREKKKEVRKELRKWRRLNREKERYRERKKEYKECYEQKKKKEETERWMKEAE